jgi:hypothetical protein
MTMICLQMILYEVLEMANSVIDHTYRIILP